MRAASQEGMAKDDFADKRTRCVVIMSLIVIAEAATKLRWIGYVEFTPCACRRAAAQHAQYA